MTSKNKMKKLKNSHFVPGWLKNKFTRMKGGAFYNASMRQVNKKINLDD